MQKTSQKPAPKRKVPPKIVPSAIHPAKRGLPKALAMNQVFKTCDTTTFQFRTTAEVKANDDIISQKRAVRAIDVGLGIRRPGYNIYVAGFQGTGKTSVIRSFLEKYSKKASTPCDWVYVHNFKQPSSPRAIALSPGAGYDLSVAMDDAIKELKDEIPSILQSEDYENAVNARISQNNDRQARFFSELEKLARSMDFQVKSTRLGIETIPYVEGRPLSEKEYNKLSDKERTRVEKRRSELEPSVLEFARQVRSLEIDTKEFVAKLQRRLVSAALERIFEDTVKAFKSEKEVGVYLAEVKEDILNNLLDFVTEEPPTEEEAVPTHLGDAHRDRFRKYRVNVFVDNRESKGAPVVIESNPTYYNLFGKVEKNVEHGMFLTDFTMIKAGAFHKANGGYIVLDAADILKLPYVWDTLKRVLRNRKGFIEDIGEQFSMFPTSGLRPEPIPLDVQVIMIGTDEIYHLLLELDDEFSKIVKIKADFDFKMPRTKSTLDAYVSFIATRCNKEGLLHFDKTGVAAVIEHSSRLVEDQTQLSTQFGTIKDLTIEADFIAREAASRVVKREHVEEAIKQKFDRVNLYETHLMEMVKSEDIMISVKGERIGQVNGLAVYDLGDYSFGKIGRITCTSAVNDDGIFNIERASKLSGNIHDKGMYILSGFLNALLARQRAIGFSASIAFEQSYGVVDGDSATIAELVSVVSAMALIPVRQCYAITGSLNQFGDVQAVGGINEKIEGFAKSCEILGDSHSTFGVVIPFQNVSNLMLGKDAREMVKGGRLHVYPVRYFWEAFEIVTGVSFGAKTVHDESFVKGSALSIIQQKLNRLEEEHEKHLQHEIDLAAHKHKNQVAAKKR